MALTYASGTLSASVGASAFPPISDGTAFVSLLAEFVVQGGNGQGSTFDEVTVPLSLGLVVNGIVPTPTATPPMGLETTIELNLSSMVSPVSELIASMTTNSLPYTLVNAGDETGLYDAVERANAGEIQAISLNADLPTTSLVSVDLSAYG